MSAVKNIRVCCMFVVLSVSLWAVPASFAGEVIDAQELYRRAVSGVVWVIVNDGSGTGWVLDRQRKLIVTNHHVIENDDKPYVVFPEARDGRVIAERSYYVQQKKYYVGKVVVDDPKHDLAIIRLDALPASAVELPLALLPASPGQRVHTIGQPGASGGGWIYSGGAVRQVFTRPDNAAQLPNVRVVETSLPINHGDSGGPTLDDEGRVIAVNCLALLFIPTRDGTRDPVNLVSTNVDVREVRDLWQRYLQQQTAAASSPFGRLPAPAVR